MNKQLKVLHFIRRYIAAYGYPPTYREIGSACRLSSTSHVAYYINGLQRAGQLTRKRYRCRSLQVK